MWIRRCNSLTDRLLLLLFFATGYAQQSNGTTEVVPCKKISISREEAHNFLLPAAFKRSRHFFYAWLLDLSRNMENLDYWGERCHREIEMNNATNQTSKPPYCS